MLIGNVRTIFNTKCIRCHVIEKEMVVVGPIPFCTSCALVEFGELLKQKCANVDPHSGIYRKWLKIYKESLDV